MTPYQRYLCGETIPPPEWTPIVQRFDRKYQWGGMKSEGTGYLSYLDALAAQSGCWEEYCEFRRIRHVIKPKSSLDEALADICVSYVDENDLALEEA